MTFACSSRTWSSAVRKVVAWTSDREAEFFTDQMLFDAVVRNLTVLGEAAKNIPDDVRSVHPDIRWRQIAGLRDVAIHFYFGLNREIIWDIVSVQVPRALPLLRQAVEHHRPA